jgi:LysR family transcriptional regulator, transcriptional activator of nhaA
MRVEWLNYHHLYYFWRIAEEGGLARAARKLHLTHSTLSAQLQALERSFDSPLFERKGKRLVLTPFGVEAASYASDIFRLGRELTDVAQRRTSPSREVLRVGVVEELPKSLAYRLLTPALDASPTGSVQVRQRDLASLVQALSAGRLHVVLCDEAAAAGTNNKIHTHALGETEIFLYATRALASSLRGPFPESLRNAPFVLPPEGTVLRRKLDDWLAVQGVPIQVRAEIGDAGLLRVFGSGGRGVFPVRAALRAEVEELHDVQKLGVCEGLRESYFAISTERRVTHPAVGALIQSARSRLHATPPKRPRR